MSAQTRPSTCPSCAGEVERAAIRCRHCGYPLVGEEWLGRVRAYARMPPPERLRWMQSLPAEQGRRFREIWRVLGHAEGAAITSRSLDGTSRDASQLSRYDAAFFVGLLGVVFLILGCFAPALHLPIVGSINLFRNGQGDGVLVLVIAGGSVLFLLRRWFPGVAASGLAAGALLAFTYYNVTTRLSTITGDLDRELAGNPFRGVADALVAGIEIQWGWALLLVGVLLHLVAAFLAPRQSKSGTGVCSALRSHL